MEFLLAVLIFDNFGCWCLGELALDLCRDWGPPEISNFLISSALDIFIVKAFEDVALG